MAGNEKAGWIKLALFLSVVGGAILASRFVTRDHLTAFIEQARGMGFAGYAVFVAAYAVWVAAGLPASVMSLGAAITFGLGRGLAVVWIGANLGAIIGFMCARYAARDWFARIVGKRLALAQINRAVAAGGWKIVMLTRLPPVSPFSIVSYAYGLTDVRFSAFLLGTAIGVVPGTAAFMYVGVLVGGFAQSAARQRTPAEWAFYIGGAVVSVLVCVYLVRVARAALARHAIEETPSPNPPAPQSPPATPG